MNEYGKRVAKKMEDYMGDPNSVDKEINDIQNAIEGVEVRGALAAGVKKSFTKSKEAIGVTQSLIDGAFDDAELVTEIESKLNQLEQDYAPKLTNVKGQVSQAYNKMNKIVTSSKQRKPIISIIDDDARTDFLDTWLPLLQNKDFKIDIAAITNLVDKHSAHMSWEQLRDLKNNYQVDIINHSHTHPHLDTLQESEIRQEFEISKQELFDRGFYSGDVFVYPAGRNNYRVRQIAKDYFKGAFFNRGGNNYPPLVQFNLRRTIMFGQDSFGDMSHIKQMIDNAVENNGWVVFITHSQFGGFDYDKVAEVIDYANQYVNNGQLEWVHASEGLDKIGNMVDIGDNEYQSAYDEGVPYPYKIVDCEGKEHSNFEMPIGRLGASVNFNTPVEEFPRDQKSLAYIYSSNPTVDSFPDGPGVLETFHALNPNFSYQRFKPFSNNEEYLRRWNNGNWSEFERVSNIRYKEDGNIDFNTPITSFTTKSVTVTNITNSNPTVGLFPEGPGVLETVRAASVAFSYQRYKPIGSNQLYQRTWDNGAWNSFQRVGEDINYAGTGHNFNTPPREFRNNYTTVSIITNANSDGFPEGVGGTLITYRYGGFQYTYQTWKPYLTNNLYVRSSNADGSGWNGFSSAK